MSETINAKRTAKKKKRILRRILVTLIVLILAAGIGIYVWARLRDRYTVTYDEYTATTGTISNSLSFSGSLALRDSATYTAPSAATVRNVYVASGDAVKKGDRLVRLSSGTTYTADFDGRVNLVSVETGDEVSAGATLVQIADFDHMQVSFRIDEYDIGDVRVGDRCTVTATATEKVFSSRVETINYISSSTGNVAYYTATANVDVDSGVYPGMQVTVTVPQEEAVDVGAEGDALSFTLENQAFVYKMKEDETLEEVYLVSRTRTADRGTGLITSVDGSSFTVLVTSGDFFLTDNIVVSREENHAAESRIGRGNLTRISPRAVTGSGTILSVAVQPGEEVRQGQLLFETIDASFDSPELARAEVKAGVDGVVASISATQGSTLTQSGLVASIYPQDRVWVKAEVTETDLSELTVGQQVKVELDWNQDHGVSYEGTVEMISALGTVGEESTTYPVYISFIPDENTRYSMSALVTTLENGTAEAAQDGDGQEEAPEEAAEPEEGRRGGRPDSGDGVPEERPEGEGRQSG